MKRIIFLFLILLAALSVGCSRGDALKRVAIIDFDNLTGNPENRYLQQAIAEHLTTYLTNSGVILLRDRQDIYAGFAEIHASRNEEERLAQLKSLGRKIDSEYLVVGSLAKIENNFVLAARVFSVSRGEIIPGSAIENACQEEYQIYYSTQTIGAYLAGRLKAMGAIASPTPTAITTPNAPTRVLNISRPKN